MMSVRAFLRRHPLAAVTGGVLLLASAAWAADVKISAMTAGDPAQATDAIPIARAGANFQLTAGSIAALRAGEAYVTVGNDADLSAERALTAGEDIAITDGGANSTATIAQSITALDVLDATASPGATQNDYSPTGWDDAEPGKATILRLTPTQGIGLTGLAGGTEGRIAILVNASDPTASGSTLVWLEHESAASSAANRFRFSDKQARWLLPGDALTLVYDSTASRWIETPRGRLADAFSTYDAASGSNASAILSTIGLYAVNASGTGASCQGISYLPTDTTQKPYGLLQCDTGTTTTGSASWMHGAVSGSNANNGYNPAQGFAFLMTRVAVSDLSDATEEYDLVAGLHDYTTGSGTDGIFWRYDRNAATVWQYCVRGAGSETCSASAVTVDTDFIWLAVYADPAWSAVEFFHSQDGVAWTRAGSQTGGNVPIAGERLGPTVSIMKSAGTTQQDLYIDMLAHRYDVIGG